jgi:hypothetical protein
MSEQNPNQTPSQPAQSAAQTEATKTAASQKAAAAQRQRPTFIVECGDKYNSTITLDTFTTRLRGRCSVSEFMGNAGRTIGDKMAAMPNIPGIRIAVFIPHKKVRIYDPLGENSQEAKRLLDSISRQLRKARQKQSSDTLTPVEERVIDLDDDKLKTLVLEIHMHVSKGSMFRHNGEIPSKELIAKMPGHELTNPWSNSRIKPKYKKDVAAFEERLLSGQMGGVTGG